jgi:hypothetical protein
MKRRVKAIICHFIGHTTHPVVGDRRKTGESQDYEVDLSCGRKCGYGYTLYVRMEFVSLQAMAPPLQPGESRPHYIN